MARLEVVFEKYDLKTLEAAVERRRRQEQRRLNGYLVNAMVATLSEAYDHEEFRDKLELTDEDGNKNISLRLRMARLLTDLRDYKKANDFLRPVVQKFPEHKLAEELNEKIQKDLEENKKQEALMNIKNHPPYIESEDYKLSLDLADFILKRYSPLDFAVGWLLEKAEKASQPDDPFVLLYYIKWYMKTGDTEKMVQALKDAAKRQPDFVPTLRLVGNYYELIGEQEKAVDTFSHILELYPGESAWLIYEKNIIAYNENNKVQ